MGKPSVSQDLVERYGEESANDLVARKTALGQFEENPDFPSREDRQLIRLLTSHGASVHLVIPSSTSTKCINDVSAVRY